MKHPDWDRRSDRGNVLPVMLALAIGIIALAVALMPAAFGVTFRANAQTAADAAAIAGAQELRGQLVYGDHTQDLENLDLAQVCAEAADYAQRNDGELVQGRCDVDQSDDGFYVTVTVRNERAVEARPSETPDPEDPQQEVDEGRYQDVHASARAQ